jgi:double-stranded uracil-DNA glycosylase
VKRPSPDDLADAPNRTINDVIGPGLDVLFVGINPGLWSGATGFHFARPGNRFWKAIYGAGLTPELLTPDRQHELLKHGIGITNLVERTTARASELSKAELEAGARVLVKKVVRYRPKNVAFLGVSAFAVAFAGSPKRIGTSDVWVLPNPSGLNAHYQLPDLARAYAALKAETVSLDTC